MERFVSQVKQKLEDKNMTQEALAKAINKDRSFVCNILAGKRNPTAETMLAICKVLDFRVPVL